MKIPFAIVAVLWCGAGAPAVEPPRFHPAHWVTDASSPEPSPPFVFSFSRLAFASPDAGWIGGDAFALQVRGERLEVAYLQSEYGSVRDLVVTSTGTPFMLVSFTRQPDTVFSRAGDAWRGEDLGTLVEPGTRIVDLLALDGDRVVAVLRPGVPGSGYATGPPRYAERAGGHWRRLAPPVSADSDLRLVDACVPPAGPAWVVGVARPHVGGGEQPVVWRVAGDEWDRVALPESLPPASAPSGVLCLPDGQVVIDLWVSDPRAPRTNSTHLLLRHDGAWHLQPLPDEALGLPSTNVAGASADDLWLAVNCAGGLRYCRPRLVRWQGGAWSAEDAPPQSGTADGYDLSAVSVGADGRGWAVGRSTWGPLRGVILRRDGGVWRVADWNWHFWDRPLGSILFD